jgi:hypothetical protein
MSSLAIVMRDAVTNWRISPVVISCDRTSFHECSVAVCVGMIGFYVSLASWPSISVLIAGRSAGASAAT